MFQSRLEFWKSKGLNPSVIYDIGANVGEWTRTMKGIFPDAHYELFEANKDNAPSLQGLNHHIVLLGDKEECQVPFYKIKNGYNTGDSMYLEVSDAFGKDNYNIDYLEKVRLNTYIQSHNLPVPDLIKIDVQGAELDVLRGMEDHMSSVRHCILEVSLHRWNSGAPMVEEVIDYMYKKGFYMVDILEYHIVRGYTMQVDLLFSHASTGFRKENFY